MLTTQGFESRGPRPTLPAPWVLQHAEQGGLPAKGLLHVQGGCGVEYLGVGRGAGCPHITAWHGGAVRR